MAGALLELPVHLGRERRRARGEQAHVPHQAAVEAWIAEKPIVEGRHTHHRGDFRKRRQNPVEVEPVEEDHCPAGKQERVYRDEQAMGMKYRQRVKQDVVGREAPDIDQRQRVGAQILMGDHRAFRAPGRAGGIKDGGKVAALASDGGKLCGGGSGLSLQRAFPLCADGLDGSIGSFERGRPSVPSARIADENAGLRILEEIVDLGGRVGGVERQVDRAEPQTGEVGPDASEMFSRLHGNPVALPHAERAKGIGISDRELKHVAIGEGGAFRRA